MLGEHLAPIAIPAERGANGAWRILDEAAIRRLGFTQTARRFQTINNSLKHVGQGKSLQERIDERSKLTKQHFGTDGFLILAGAGGKHICAACLPIAEARDFVVDQTLYWKIILNGDEAWFCVGLLNSHAMTEAITAFNPKGAFGERHIHALPYRFLPNFDSSNEDHLSIARLARELAVLARDTIAGDEDLSDPNRALTWRRSRLRAKLLETDQGRELDLLCAALLGTTSAAEDAEDTSSDLAGAS